MLFRSGAEIEMLNLKNREKGPSKAFTSFVSNPPAGDSGLGFRV